MIKAVECVLPFNYVILEESLCAQFFALFFISISVFLSVFLSFSFWFSFSSSFLLLLLPDYLVAGVQNEEQASKELCYLILVPGSDDVNVLVRQHLAPECKLQS